MRSAGEPVIGGDGRAHTCLRTWGGEKKMSTASKVSRRRGAAEIAGVYAIALAKLDAC